MKEKMTAILSSTLLAMSLSEGSEAAVNRTAKGDSGRYARLFN
jgi:hypothetical protein